MEDLWSRFTELQSESWMHEESRVRWNKCDSFKQRQRLSSQSKLRRHHGGGGVDTGRRHSILNCKPEANMSQLPGR